MRDYSGQLGAKIAHFLEGVPRFALSGKHIHEHWDPRSPNYYESVGITGAPFIIFGIFLFVTINIVWLSHSCKYRFNMQRLKQISPISGARTCAIFLFIIVGCCAAISLIFSILVQKNIKGTLSTIQETQSLFIHEIDHVENLLVELNATNFLTPDLQEGINWIKSSQKYTEEYGADIIHAGNILEFSLVSFYSFLIIVVIFTLIAAITSSRRVILISIIFGIFSLLILWFICGGSTSASVFVADACPELESYIENRTSENAQKFLGYYFECSGDNPLDHVIKEANIAEWEVQSKLNYTLAHNSTHKNETVKELEDMLKNLQKLEIILNQLSNCNTTVDQYTKAKDAMCVNILNLMAGIFLLSAGGGFFIFGGIWSAIKFRARLRILNEVYNYQPINQIRSGSRNSYEVDTL